MEELDRGDHFIERIAFVGTTVDLRGRFCVCEVLCRQGDRPVTA